MSPTSLFPSSHLADAALTMSLKERATLFEMIKKEVEAGDASQWKTTRGYSLTGWLCQLGRQLAEEHGGDDRQGDLEQLAPAMQQLADPSPLSRSDGFGAADFVTELWACLADRSFGSPKANPALGSILAAYAPILRSWVARGYEPGEGPQALCAAAAAIARHDAVFLKDLSRFQSCPLGLFSTHPEVAGLPGAVTVFLAAGGTLEERLEGRTVGSALHHLIKCYPRLYPGLAPALQLAQLDIAVGRPAGPAPARARP